MGIMKKALGISSATMLVFLLFLASCCGCGLFGVFIEGQELEAARQIPATSPQTIIESYEKLKRIEQRWDDTDHRRYCRVLFDYGRAVAGTEPNQA